MRLKRDLVLRHIGKEHVIVKPGLGSVDLTHVYTLNNVAAWLWEQVPNEEFTEEDWVELLIKRYDVSREKAEEDVRKLVTNLRKNGLIV
ncbi:MAG: PqqD family protein [Mediterranea sp.]|jgi:hypothetical protein|nr:PqqD family protein [Mediterranea sp.]